MLHPPQQETLFPEKTLRDLVRRLVYGSPAQKTLALELFGAEHLNQSYSRLSKTLQPDPPTFFDIDWIVPALRILGNVATDEFLAWLCAALDYDKPRRKKQPTDDERLDALESRILDDSQRMRRDLEELAELRRARDRKKSK